MKNILAIVALLLTVSILQAQPAALKVAATPHNLSSSGTSLSSNTTQICVFCHTPHNAIDPATAGVRLWNHTLSNPSAWTLRYKQDPGGGAWETPTHAPSNQGGSVLCLSCHDGTVAVSSLHNPPSDIDGDVVMNADGALAGTSTTTAMLQEENGNAWSIGTDFETSHPFGIAYANIANNPTGPILSQNYSYYSRPATVTATSAKVVAGSWSLPLFQHKVAGNGNIAGDWFVECRSCHDVHGTAGMNSMDPVTKLYTGAPTNGGGQLKSLLLVPNSNSQMCAMCHYNK